jgi:hypothetical protein
MQKRSSRAGRSSADAAWPQDPQQFADNLKRRRKAAQGLERDLLTSVPLLYGSPGDAGDPGIVLARAHREEMLQRNCCSFFRPSGKRSEVVLPWERAITAFAILLWLLMAFAE